METEPKKTRTKGGRPRKYASDEKRPTMAFRIRGGMHEKLIASAKARDVSLSEEIERRLEASFQFAADPYMDTALRMAAANCQVVQNMLGKNIAEDAYTRAACAKAAASAIELVGGLAGDKSPETIALLQTEAEGFGQLVAMFTEAMRRDVKNDFTEALGQIAEIVAGRRNADIEQQAAIERAALARLLREGAQPAPAAPQDEPELPLVDEPALPAQADAPPEPAPKRRGRPRKAG